MPRIVGLWLSALCLGVPLTCVAQSIAPLPPVRPAELGRRAPEPVSPEPKPPVPDISPKPAPPPDATASSSCLDDLKAVPGNRLRAAEAPAKNADPTCRVEEPVVLEALATRAGSVTFEPPPTLSCAMAKAVGVWLSASAQPLSKGYFERDLTTLRVGGGQECRRRNQSASGPVSEHATGKALDIFAFKIGSGHESLEISVEKATEGLQQQFLTAIRQSACGAFSTVLGPGSDPSHANHLHLDIQDRRSRASRFCQ